MPQPVTLLKKRLWQRCFPVNFAKFLRTPFLQNTLGDCFSFLPISRIFIKAHYVLAGAADVDRLFNLEESLACTFSFGGLLDSLKEVLGFCMQPYLVTQNSSGKLSKVNLLHSVLTFLRKLMYRLNYVTLSYAHAHENLTITPVE